MSAPARIAAIIGGGVIGAGWAARFALMGWEVRVFDPGAGAAQAVDEVLANARAALPGLSDRAPPPEGPLKMVATVQDAVEGAHWIQESVPERLDLKHAILAQIQTACARDAIIGSSTSGFTPTQLQQGAARPGQILVAHPFNPVYLLPLVELVASPATPTATIAQAQDMQRSIGMHPLHVRAEIDAHIADRLLEAVWREALWLVKDGIATTAEIDEAIRLGFGLRWAQMGLFETYRIAGGEAGMAHFIAQFGPCLKWPWSKLTDVPDLTPELVARIAAQSDTQSGHMSLRELERLRDGNLVAILRALKARNTGAGAVLNAAEPPHPAPDFSAPLRTLSRAVPLDWTDYNGHMTEARYLDAFGNATDRFMEIIGCDATYIAEGRSFFTAETHIRHRAECHVGDHIVVDTQLIGARGKTMHIFHRLTSAGELRATGEHMMIHVDLSTRRACPPGDTVAERLAEIDAAHSALPEPDGLGAAITPR